MHSGGRVLAWAIAVAVAATAWGQSSRENTAAIAPGDTPGLTPGVSASRVALDLVVRDNRGRLVRDLIARDVEVFEDGVPQELLSIRLVDATAADAEGAPPGLEAAATTPPSPSEPVRGGRSPSLGGESGAVGPGGSGPDATGVDGARPLYLAFLFDRLSPVARHLARDAAIEWLEQPAPAGLQVGVFRIDQTLETLQSFTDDPRAAAEAVESVVKSTPSTFRSKSDRQRLRGVRQAIRLLGGDEPGPQGVPGALPLDVDTLEATARTYASSFVTQDARAFEAARLRLEMAMLEASEALERDQQGLTTVNSLLALVNGLKQARGRKAVVFFSEGLLLPPRVASAFQSVVSEANRGGVTFYAADAAGLRTQSAGDENRRELAGLVEELGQGSTETGLGNRSLTRVLERNEDLLRFDPASGLGALARETGGFLVTDTNAIAGALRAAREDLGAYYLLEYAPANELFDGRFRRIEVQVHRKGVSVQARKGYFAVRTRTPTPLLDFEAPVLAALELAPGANEMPFRAAVLRVPGDADESAVPLVIEVTGDAPSVDTDGEGEHFHLDFTGLVLVRDETGGVVRKLSRRVVHSGPVDEQAALREGKIVLLRETSLPPGRYTVEVAVRDAVSGRLGVHRQPLEIPDESGRDLRVSSLVVVGHLGPPRDGAPEAPALVVRDLQLYPTAAGVFSASEGKPISYFVEARTAAGRPPPRGVVELRREDGSSVSEGEVVLSLSPEGGRRASILQGLLVDGVAPGTYELRVTIGDGVDRSVRAALVRVVP